MGGLESRQGLSLRLELPSRPREGRSSLVELAAQPFDLRMSFGPLVEQRVDGVGPAAPGPGHPADRIHLSADGVECAPWRFGGVRIRQRDGSLRAQSADALGEAKRRGEVQLNPRLVVSSGEVLLPQDRIFLRETFGAPVRNLYASTEHLYMALDLPERRGDGMYLIEDDLMFELRDDSPVPPMAFNLETLTVDDLIDKDVRVVGFGVTNGEEQTGGGTKRRVNLTIDGVTAAHLTLGDDTRNICQGDSGGPYGLLLNAARSRRAHSRSGNERPA